MASTEERLL